MNAKVEKTSSDGIPKKDSRAVLEPTTADSVNPAAHVHCAQVQRAADEVLSFQRSKDKWNMEIEQEDSIAEVNDSNEILEARNDQKSEEEEKGGSEEDSAGGILIKPVTGERKARSKRNKERRIRAMKIRRLESMKKKRRNAQFEKIGDIVSAIDKAEERRKSGNEKKMKEDGTAPSTKRLAGAQVPTEAESRFISISEDLGLSLREIAPPAKNTLLSERFTSFQRRGFIIPNAAALREAKRAKAEKREYERKRGIRKVRPGRGSRSGLTFFKRRLGSRAR